MKFIYQKHSAFDIADPELIAAIGRCMVAFAAIEGRVNFALSFFLKNHDVFLHIENERISRRLDLFLTLAKKQPFGDHAALTQFVKDAKELFKKRNLIAHNPIMMSGDKGRFISRIGKTGQELSAAQIEEIALQADEIHARVCELFVTSIAPP